jgi:hypothetical protein
MALKVEGATRATGDAAMGPPRRGREWRVLGAVLVVPGALSAASMAGGALDPFTAPSTTLAALDVATGLLGVLSLQLGLVLLLSGRLRRSAGVVALAWVGLIAVQQASVGAIVSPSYLWLPQLTWLAFLGFGAWRARIGRAFPDTTRRDTGWRVLGLALVVPGLWFGRSLVFMRLMGQPWAAGTVDLAYWLVQAAAVPSLVAGAWVLATGRGRTAAALAATAWLGVSAALLAFAADQGLPVTLVVPGAWLAVLLLAEGGVVAVAALRRAHPPRPTRPAGARVVDGGRPTWRTALTGAAVFAGGFAATVVLIAGALH